MTQNSIPYDGIKGVSRLFSTYTSDYDQLSDYYVGDWRDQQSFRNVAQNLTDNPVNRQGLVNVIEKQNAKWNNPDLAHRLLDPESLAVVTGQQVGIFGGPLYTLYKALTAIQLSEYLTDILSRPVIPVFWLEGGDHDLDEVRHVNLFGRKFWYEGHQPPPTGNLGSVGSLPFNEHLDRVKSEILDHLPQTEFVDNIFDHYYSGYCQGETFTDAFARTLRALLGGKSMVFINPEDDQLKQLVAPLFRRELDEYEITYSTLKATSHSLEKDFHAQVHISPGNLFLLSESGRQALCPNAEGYTLKYPDEKTFSFDEVRAISPRRFSPNVIMRPLVQDSLLPTVAYVAGPSEVAYFAQLNRLYVWAKRPMPVIFPRSSLTLIERRVQKIMNQHNLTVSELACEVPDLMRQRVLDGSALSEAFNKANTLLDNCAEGLHPTVVGIDVTLGPTVEATHRQWTKDLSKLQLRVERAEKRHHQQLQSQIELCKQAIYPNGNLQERELPVLYYLAKYGDSVLSQIRSNLRIDLEGQHQLLMLS